MKQMTLRGPPSTKGGFISTDEDWKLGLRNAEVSGPGRYPQGEGKKPFAPTHIIAGDVSALIPTPGKKKIWCEKPPNW